MESEDFFCTFAKNQGSFFSLQCFVEEGWHKLIFFLVAYEE
jgi:hypothetical protein